ncbi:MAG: 5'-nucleotidase, lipoprotein e(P4) family [Sarcina sp.]
MKGKVIGAIIIAAIVGLGVGGGIGYEAHAQGTSSDAAAATTTQTSSVQTPTAAKDQQMVMAYDWLENSGEAMSLEYQAYNTATRNLKEMATEKSSKPKAVILDIDETCLSNAPGNGYQIANNANFNVDVWNKWVDYAEATPIPGAVDFTKAAKADGYQVFYVSDRIPNQLAATQKNLSEYGFADATEPGHIILDPVADQNKQSRFDAIEKNYDVVMFVGDQLTDMGGAYMNKSSQQEKEQVTTDRAKWGWNYIAIPDPTYGNYENAMYNHSGKTLTEEQKVQMSNEGIQSFNPQTGQIIKNQNVINQ